MSLTDIYDFPEWKDSLKKYLKEIGDGIMNNENREEKEREKQVGLTTKILFGLLFGAITGFVFKLCSAG